MCLIRGKLDFFACKQQTSHQPACIQSDQLLCELLSKKLKTLLAICTSILDTVGSHEVTRWSDDFFKVFVIVISPGCHVFDGLK